MNRYQGLFNEYLVRINNVEDAPLDSYVICEMCPGGLYYCTRSKFDNLTKYLLNTEPTDLHLTMDLASAGYHSLVFDLDISFEPHVDVQKETRSVMMDYFNSEFLGILRTFFLPFFKFYTVLVAARSDCRGGLHVHLPEVVVSYDDYIELCSKMAVVSTVSIKELSAIVKMDIVSNFSLIKSSKPGGVPYEPVLLIYVDAKTKFALNVGPLNRASIFSRNFTREFQRVKSEFKITKQRERSFFRKLLLFDQVTDLKRQLYEAMSPVVTVYKPLYHLHYPTSIAPLPAMAKVQSCSGGSASSSKSPSLVLPCANDVDRTRLATFVYNDATAYEICKDLRELGVGEKEFLKCYNYINSNASVMTRFQGTNRAHRLWYKRFRGHDPFLPHSMSGRRSTIVDVENESVFHKVQRSLRDNNFNFRQTENPLRTIMLYDRGYYFLPVFYALSKFLNLAPDALVSHLRPVLGQREGEDLRDKDRFPGRLLNELERVPSQIIESVASEFTMGTILYCASNVEKGEGCRDEAQCGQASIPARSAQLKDRMTSIVHEMKGALLFAESAEEFKKAIREIQGRHSPVMTATMRHSCKRAQMHQWNPTSECWQLVEKDATVEKFILYVWGKIKEFLRNHKSEEDYNKWWKTVGRKVNAKEVADEVLCETNMERKIVEMDRHKWHVRTKDGILELLTGHVGGTVPEFFMSERKMTVDLNRFELSGLREESRDDLARAYERLTDRRFFQKYLKALFKNETEDLFETLLLVAGHDNSSRVDEWVLSMYRFYVHLCKYTSFEYIRLMHMLDVIASLLVATNYARKFFVLKGVTKNGKSKFFQMISRVFGGYSYSARSVNLQCQGASHGLSAMPELATSLFGCRVVTVEELSGKLNENLIKEITGNSSTSFREMFQQSSGGIPTAKILASTNSLLECTATEAFKDRVVAFPFDARFTSDARGLTTTEKVLGEKYVLDTSDAMVENSHVGFFIMSYFHFFLNRNESDGTLHSRPEPEALVEFKKDILYNTDIYQQFKLYVDVQLIPHSNHSTMVDDLKSAIRYFLKNTKTTSVHESDIVLRFDEEFGHLKKTMFPDWEEDAPSLPHVDFLGSACEKTSIFRKSYGSIARRCDDDDSSQEDDGEIGTKEIDGSPPNKIVRFCDQGAGGIAQREETVEEGCKKTAIFYYDWVVIKNLGQIVKLKK